MDGLGSVRLLRSSDTVVPDWSLRHDEMHCMIQPMIQAFLSARHATRRHREVSSGHCPRTSTAGGFISHLVCLLISDLFVHQPSPPCAVLEADYYEPRLNVVVVGGVARNSERLPAHTLSRDAVCVDLLGSHPLREICHHLGPFPAEQGNLLVSRLERWRCS
jgi:hypothetical protein